MEPERLEFFRNLLQNRLTALLASSNAELTRFTGSFDRSSEELELAALESNREFTLRLRDRERVLIDKIREAMNRIEAGDYGICAACGSTIPERRLLARPVATHCVDCRTEAEPQAAPGARGHL